MASALASSTIKGVSLTQKVNRTASKTSSVRAVVCRASLEKEVKKVIAAGVSVPAVLAASPAMAAVVENRLNGDGAGLPLGINDPAAGWAILLTFTLVWALYYISQRELGGDENDESGMTL